MKKTILVIAVLFGFAISTSAQDERRAEKPTADKMTERMKTQLELSDEQYKPVYVANAEMIKMIEEAGGREADRETVAKIRKEHLAKLNEILTAEQMGKMKDQVQQRDRKRKHSKIEKPE